MTATTIVTVILGVAGIAGSITGVIVGNRSESNRAFSAEKRKVYVQFNSSIETLWIIATSSYDFKVEPGRGLYSDALRQLWSAFYEIKLVASDKDVIDLAYRVTWLMGLFARELLESSPARRTELAERGPTTDESDDDDDFNEMREKLVSLMYNELPQPRLRRATQSSPSRAQRLAPRQLR